MALRIMWVSGSARRSMTVLSTSVASPSVTRRTDLPVIAATSRTSRGIRWNTDFTGWARIAMTLSWISRVSCSSSSRPIGDGRGAREARLQDALRQHRLVDDEFADEIDQPIDAVEIDADRRRCRFEIGLGIAALLEFCFAGSGATGAAALGAGVGGFGRDDWHWRGRRLGWASPSTDARTRAKSAATSSSTSAGAARVGCGFAVGASISRSQSHSTNSKTSRIAVLVPVGRKLDLPR